MHKLHVIRIVQNSMSFNDNIKCNFYEVYGSDIT